MTSDSHGVPPRGMPRRLAVPRAAAGLLTAGAAASSSALGRGATAGAALGVRTAGLCLRSGTAVGAIGATGGVLGFGHGDFLSFFGVSSIAFLIEKTRKSGRGCNTQEQLVKRPLSLPERVARAPSRQVLRFFKVCCNDGCRPTREQDFETVAWAQRSRHVSPSPWER